MPSKDKILFVSICSSIMLNILQVKKSTVGNIDSCFSHHQRGHLIALMSTWYLLKICNSLPTNSFTNSLVLVVCSKISKLQSFSIIDQTIVNINIEFKFVDQVIECSYFELQVFELCKNL